MLIAPSGIFSNLIPRRIKLTHHETVLFQGLEEMFIPQHRSKQGPIYAFAEPEDGLAIYFGLEPSRDVQPNGLLWGGLAEGAAKINRANSS